MQRISPFLISWPIYSLNLFLTPFSKKFSLLPLFSWTGFFIAQRGVFSFFPFQKGNWQKTEAVFFLLFISSLNFSLFLLNSGNLVGYSIPFQYNFLSIMLSLWYFFICLCGCCFIVVFSKFYASCLCLSVFPSIWFAKLKKVIKHRFGILILLELFSIGVTKILEWVVLLPFNAYLCYGPALVAQKTHLTLFWRNYLVLRIHSPTWFLFFRVYCNGI